MATRLPSALPRRPSLSFSPLTPTPSTTHHIPSHTPLSHTPSRAATLIRRPRRPYTFTQLVQLSDGSTFTIRTCSPLGMYKSTKDTRNHVLWNPNEKSLQNVEVDEAGKLAAFRERFGRGWDVAAAPAAEGAAAGKEGKDGKHAGGKEAVGGGEVGSGDALADLIAGYAVGMEKEHAPVQTQKQRGAAKKK